MLAAPLSSVNPKPPRRPLSPRRALSIVIIIFRIVNFSGNQKIVLIFRFEGLVYIMEGLSDVTDVADCL